jgi:chromosomal replication initiator protein
MSDELTTRFMCGLVSRMEAPDLKTRQQIVRLKMQPFAGQIAEDALDFVARRFAHSVRELEGALNTLRTWHAMTKAKVSVQTARQALSDLERDCIRVVRLPDIEAAVCQLFGIDAIDLKSSKRTRSVSQPRMLAMFLARRHTQAAYKEIGDFFGGRNHSTVVAAEKKIDTWLRAEKELTFAGRNWHLSDIMESIEQQLLAG